MSKWKGDLICWENEGRVPVTAHVSYGIGVREMARENEGTDTIHRVFLMKTRFRASKKRTWCVRFLPSFSRTISLTPIDVLQSSL